MKIIAILLFMMAGMGALGGIRFLQTTATVGPGAYIGAFICTALLVWWGLIALRISEKRTRGKSSA